MREAVGLFDQSSFAKYELTGTDAAEGAVDWICRQRRRQAGRPPHLHPAAQLARRHRGRSHRGAARRRPILHRHRHRLPHPRLRLDRRPHRRRARRALTDVTEEFGTLSLMGPRARDVLAAVDRRRRVERGLPVRPCARDHHRRRHGAGAARHLCRRARLGAARADRRDRRGVRRADGGRRAARHPARSATARWNRCGWRRATAPGAPTSRPTTRRSRPGSAGR